MPHFKINATKDQFGSTVEMDGQPLQGVRAVTVNVAVGCPTTVTVEMFGSVEITGEGELHVKRVEPGHARGPKDSG